ncbi:MAG TPA: nitronate monooxygenase family protein [Kofleriaceae bacterium]|jgi:nitronate monooxygenase
MTDLLALIGIEAPLLLAPMAGFGTVELAIGVARAGALGALPCASLSIAEADAQVAQFRAAGPWPLHVNFFCHQAPVADAAVLARWRERLAPYHDELGVPRDTHAAGGRAPFDEAWCAWVERTRPQVASFHFGLPAAPLLARVKATGARVLASATTVREAVWLEAHGCDAIIAQGTEAGGHRGMFLTDDAAAQVGTFALVPQVVDAVRVPVIAAGGVTDGRAIRAAFALGAVGVLAGTAYLRCPEARTSALHRRALETVTDDATAITNVFTGRPARGIETRLVRDLGPLSADAPPFPLAAAAVAPLKARAEAAGSTDFSNLWAGQAARLARAEPAEAVTARLLRESR